MVLLTNNLVRRCSPYLRSPCPDRTLADLGAWVGRRCFVHHTATPAITSPTTDLLADYNLNDPDCNVTPTIAAKIGQQLHRRPNHPLQILTNRIAQYFGATFPLYDNLSPIVSTTANFDSLNIPIDHVSRSKSDTYYLNNTTVLRTHTSAHQTQLLSAQLEPNKPPRLLDQFLLVGDVYRRDEIDKSHYPVFHQMEGVKLWPASSSSSTLSSHPHNNTIDDEAMQTDLKCTLEGLAQHLFGSDVEMRWVDAYFPFTEPSCELEIWYENEWLEVLGCGVIHPNILHTAGRSNQKGWAFGLGLERLAMVLFQIPDIRLFWSTDPRFTSQFASGQVVHFQPYSKYPPCKKDLSFWLPNDPALFHVNDLNEVIRTVGGDLVEQVELMDEFVHPHTHRISHCYRIVYRSMDRSLTNEEIDAVQELVRQRVAAEIGAELR